MNFDWHDDFESDPDAPWWLGPLVVMVLLLLGALAGPLLAMVPATMLCAGVATRVYRHFRRTLLLKRRDRAISELRHLTRRPPPSA